MPDPRCKEFAFTPFVRRTLRIMFFASLAGLVLVALRAAFLLVLYGLEMKPPGP